MKKEVFSKSSNIKGRKSSGSEDSYGYNHWRSTDGRFNDECVN